MLFLKASFSDVAPWITQYGYWVVFVALALENVLLTSMIVPGLIVLIAGGFAAGVGNLAFAPLVGSAIAGVWIGDTTSYAIGRILWSRLLATSRLGDALVRMRRVLAGRGAPFIVFYHFEPIARMLGATAAGTANIPLRRWLPYDYLGGALWVLFYSTVGFALGRAGRDAQEWERLRPLTLVFTAILLIWLWFLARNMRRLAGAAPDDTRTLPFSPAPQEKRSDQD